MNAAQEPEPKPLIDLDAGGNGGRMRFYTIEEIDKWLATERAIFEGLINQGSIKHNEVVTHVRNRLAAHAKAWEKKPSVGDLKSESRG